MMTGSTEGKNTVDVSDWNERISQIDRRAFELATERWRNGGVPLDQGLETEAERVRTELRDIARELRSSSPDSYLRVAETISEALLDLKYAANGSQAVSLRLNQYMEEGGGN